MDELRRGFLGSILALAAAPAIVRADSLMRVAPTVVYTDWDLATFNFLAPFDGDDLLTLKEFNREMLYAMHRNLRFISNINAKIEGAPWPTKTY